MDETNNANAHRISRIDHVAITATDLGKSSDYYIDLLGGEQLFDYIIDGKLLTRAIRAGDAMLSIHQYGNGVEPVARAPTIGAIDICFRWIGSLQSALAHLASREIEIVFGPRNHFANDGSPAISVYFRDPDGNLIEFLTDPA